MSDDTLLDIEAAEVKQGRNLWVTAVAAAAVALAAFQIYTAGAGPYMAMIQRAIHVCLAITVVTLVYRMRRAKVKPQPRILYVWDVAVIAVTIGITIYAIASVDRLVFKIGFANPSETDVILGYIIVLILADACRKAVGWIFTCCIAGFIGYAMFGNYIPGALGHAGYSPNTLAGMLFVNPLGIYGVITGTSANIIAIFVIFGAIMLRTGAAQGFLNLAVFVAGRLTGGAAQVAVISSAFMGTVNGSAVANVATTGAFTIPLMMRRGYPPRFAAGVESAASTGGQLMPPIMGAGAFIMAEILAIPYLDVAAAAAIPAFLYFGAIMMIIYFEAKKRKLTRVPKDEIPSFASYRKELFLLLVPLSVLMYLIVARYTPRYAAFWAIALTIGLFLLVNLPVGRRSDSSTPELSPSLKGAGSKVLDGLVEGGSAAATLGVLCAGAQLMVAPLGITGVGLKVSQYMAAIGGDSMLPYLIGGMIMCLLLGMALPTVPSYLITAAVAAPILSNLGLPLLAIHLFIFYFAVMSGLTPPVLGPVYAAAVYAGSNIWESAWESLKLALVGFLVPFVFVLNPKMLGLDGMVPAVESLVYGVVGALVLASGIAGYWSERLNVVQRIVMVVAGVLFIVPTIEYTVAGLALTLLALFGLRWLNRWSPAVKPAEPSTRERYGSDG